MGSVRQGDGIDKDTQLLRALCPLSNCKMVLARTDLDRTTCVAVEMYGCRWNCQIHSSADEVGWLVSSFGSRDKARPNGAYVVGHLPLWESETRVVLANSASILALLLSDRKRLSWGPYPLVGEYCRSQTALHPVQSWRVDRHGQSEVTEPHTRSGVGRRFAMASWESDWDDGVEVVVERVGGTPW